jgi:hypothetical protein
MKKIFRKMDNNRKAYCKSNYEWLLSNVLRIKPETDATIIDTWTSDLNILNEVIAEKL